MKDVKHHGHLIAGLVLAFLMISCGADTPETSDPGESNTIETPTIEGEPDTTETSTIEDESDTTQPSSGDDESDATETCPQKNLFATEVISFEPGEGAGYGSGEFPEIVLGPPNGKGNNAGGLNVLSLGVGGTITMGFSGTPIIDEPGADFIVFENPFWVNNIPADVFAELAEVSVSDDGETWHVFDCEPVDPDAGDFGQCAGWRPVQAFEVNDDYVLTAEEAGGDAYDIADLGLEQIYFVRIRDLSESGAAPTAGFDLDAVGAVNFSCPSSTEQ